MSVEIGWTNITSGPDGIALAEKIRRFIDDKFQQVPLPRFINSVHVHSFEFGSVCPEIEIKDICDPLPDFYEDDEESSDEEHSELNWEIEPQSNTHDTSHNNRPSAIEASARPLSTTRPPLTKVLRDQQNPDFHSLADSRALRRGSPDPSHNFHRINTPGIAGGTSNLSYFHFPGGGLSGTQTPLAAVASGTPFSPQPWSHDLIHGSVQPHASSFAPTAHMTEAERALTGHDDPSTRPSTATSISSPQQSESGVSSPNLKQEKLPVGMAEDADLLLNVPSPLSPRRQHTVHPSDLQVVTRVKYSGDVHMTLTANILLDYPMPSFVAIPLKLAITGMKFDGVAIVASIKKKMHFCFLDPEDAATLVGEQLASDHATKRDGKDTSRGGISSLLQEIHVESEIGRQDGGKQVLKNVGKVEKFVLEQVRKIFEEEFVFPSFWTFLI